jgi:hypothetical protein
MKNLLDDYKLLSGKEKEQLRKRIINACLIEAPTFYTWLRNMRVPKPAQKLISIELNIPIEELFPEDNN